MALSGLKIAVMWPNMVWIMNVNYLFTMFVLNSLMLIISNYHLHMKSMSAIYADHQSLRFSILLVIRLFLLFCIVMWGMYPVFGLKCHPDKYPDQLAALMYLDFFNSMVDIFLTVRMPKHLQRIRE